MKEKLEIKSCLAGIFLSIAMILSGILVWLLERHLGFSKPSILFFCCIFGVITIGYIIKLIVLYRKIRTNKLHEEQKNDDNE